MTRNDARSFPKKLTDMDIAMIERLFAMVLLGVRNTEGITSEDTWESAMEDHARLSTGHKATVSVKFTPPDR